MPNRRAEIKRNLGRPTTSPAYLLSTTQGAYLKKHYRKEQPDPGSL